MNAFFCSLIPTKAEQIFMSVGGAAGAVIGWATGGISDAFYWLCAFVVVDYLSGMAQAFRNSDWSSATGFRGLCKKIIILSCAVLSHGLAGIAGIPAIESAVIFAFAVNESGSILENIERLGYGSLIPGALRAALRVAQQKEDEMEKTLGNAGKNSKA